MKIAIHNAQISHYLGGTERAIYLEIKNLLKIDPDLEITLLTTKTENESILFKKIKALQSNRFKIVLFDISKISIEIKSDSNTSDKWHMESMQFGLRTGDYYLKNNFDLVLYHFTTDIMFLPKKFKRVLNVHGTPSKRSLLDENCLESPDVIIYTTNDIKNIIEKMHPFTKSRISKVIYLGTPVDNRIFPKKERIIDILFVGRLIKIKGVDLLIKAVHKLKNNKNLKISIIGKGPEEKNLKLLVKKLGLEKNVVFHSFVSDKKLLNIYRTTKIAVFPSYKKEGIILAMLEAASFGCGLIVSNCCGMPEFIENNSEGLLFEPKNISDLSKKINFLLNHPNKREEMGKKATDKINNYWNELSKTKELYEYLREVI
ncbi:MAG: glycosyltransferase family 4 protein [Candidatus Pacearchaeota archaeon]